MKNINVKKLLILNLPYFILGLYASNLGEAYRLAAGTTFADKLTHLMDGFAAAFSSPLPSFHPVDLLIGLCCGAGLRLAVYVKSKNAKKFRKNSEYGSARWGTHDDIAPYIDPVFQNNVILTQTERLTMSSRPKDPKTARNKNVLIIGGSGSGKTRFWLKPNLMQMHSSYVVTDPKGTILVECGKMLQRGTPKIGKDGKPVRDKHGKIVYEGYRIKVLNTINFKKSIVCYDIKELGKQLKKIGMLVVQDQVWNRVTVNRAAHKSTRYYIDEMHLLLKEEQTAAYTVEIWKRFRKWGGIPTGITQNVKDLLASREVENIFENSDFVYMLNQAGGDRQILAKQLNISPHQLSYVTHSSEGEGLLFYGSVILPFVDRFPKDTELYRIMTTKPQEVKEAN